MKNSFAVLFLVMSISSAFGQHDSLVVKHVKLKYSNSFMVGGLFGKDGSGNTFTAGMHHGIRYGRFATGLGIGYDSYTEWRSMPVYGYVSFDVVKIEQNALFVFVSGGYSKSWYKPESEDWEPDYDINDGGNFSSMVGYRIQANQYRIYVATGFKFQRINYDYIHRDWWYSSAPPPVTSVEMDLNRFVIQIGFGWR